MPKPRKRITLGVVAILLGLTACHSEPAPTTQSPTPTAQPTNWPQNLDDFRFRWSADPGFDLNTGWAVPLRAYLESLRVIYYTLDRDAGYPGLKRATPEPPETFSSEWKKLPLAQRDLRGSFGNVDVDNPHNRFVGNEDMRVLKAEPIPSGFRAFVCDATFGVYGGSTGSQLVPWGFESAKQGFNIDFTNMAVWRIEFSDNDPRAGAPPLPSPQTAQQGPLPAPRDDVFGPWFVTGASLVSGWSDSDFPGLQSDTPEYNRRLHEAQAAEEAMRQQCLAQYPLNAEQRKAIATTVIDKPPTVEPALPGWPE
ncbi:hypothetical protein CIW52_24535 [Mycolicibacterium sp. P9-64]|nr:hypothetical protein CIW52_24535 [Mycolicibacterium sp. P9-64]